MPTIRNAAEAADQVRAINRHCVASAMVTTREVPAGKRRVEVWTALLEIGVSKIAMVRYCRRRGRKSIRITDAPGHVQQYLLVRDNIWPNIFTELDEAAFDAIVPGDGILRVREFPAAPMKLRGKLITFEIKYQPTQVREGVLLFCEVGESGSGPDDFLPFPTTEKAVSEAVDRIEGATSDLEFETGWSDPDAKEG